LIFIFQFHNTLSAIDIDLSKKVVFIENFEGFHSSSDPEIGSILSADNIRLGYHCFTKENPSWCLIFFHEGGANGKAWYTGFAENLSKEYNASVFLFDIRGHGISEGLSGDTPSEVSVWQDVSSAISFIKSKFKSVPIYLGGHSYGSGLVLTYIQWNKGESPDGYILIAPQFGYKIDTDRILDERYNFVTMDTNKFIINSITGSFAHTYVVQFHYPMDLITEKNLVTRYTINMCKALTPTEPEHLMIHLNKPMHILIPKKDIIIDCDKLTAFLEKMKKKNNKISYAYSADDGHFSVLNNAHIYLNDFLVSMQAMQKVN
jgi:alpha-beta hydrolase superfamily lysophospholipase